MITCSKTYVDFPFGHRQPSHNGHCAWIHGHNWSFKFTFSATELDECGFVIDFGKLKWLKQWLEERFDHTVLLNEDDPRLEYLIEMLRSDIWSCDEIGAERLAKIITVSDCSCEGIAKFLLEEVGKLVSEQTKGRVSVSEVVVYEDSKNSATATI